tara:strand:- start:531 stop:998 length:468 start_codon:yes stop_codon:yes gene_type:complete
MKNTKPEKAFKDGIVLQSADIHAAGDIRVFLLAQLKRLVNGVNATRTFKNDEDYHDCIEDIIEVFPSLKVEEVLICFKHIRQGKYDLYGTLCTGSIIKSLHAYEEKYTIPFREQKHEAYEPYINGMIDWQKIGENLIVETPTNISLQEWDKRRKK